MDFVVKLPPSKDSTLLPSPEFDSIWVVVCRLTKYAHFIPCREEMPAEELAQLYVKHLLYRGIPVDIVSDRGSVFIARFTKSLAEMAGIRQKVSTSFHPQTDGQTERINQVLEQYLRAYCNYHQDDWVDLLSLAAVAYNNSEHATTRLSPHFATFGSNPRLRMEIPDTPSNLSAKERAEYLRTVHRSLVEEISMAQDLQARYANQKRDPTPQYAIGDRVWLLSRNIHTKRPSPKLEHKKLGPFRVTKMVSSTAYRLALPPSMKHHPVFHVSLLEKVITNDIHPLPQDPLPIEVDGEEEYEIETILDTKFSKPRGRRRKDST
jgi:hypothetical protein